MANWPPLSGRNQTRLPAPSTIIGPAGATGARGGSPTAPGPPIGARKMSPGAACGERAATCRRVGCRSGRDTKLWVNGDSLGPAGSGVSAGVAGVATENVQARAPAPRRTTRTLTVSPAANGRAGTKLAPWPPE